MMELTMPDSVMTQNLSANPNGSAHRVAIARAVHQLLDEPKVVDDALSLPLLGPELGKAVSDDPFAYNDPSARSMRAGIVARSLLAENVLNAAVARGVSQVVSLGAGLDTYALRHGASIPQVSLYEVDQPAMLELKQARAVQAGLKIPARMRFVVADLARQCWLEMLARSGFDSAQPVAISWMGVSPYLTPEQVRSVLAWVAGLAPGSVIAFRH
ncbi:class I SAM-dependent methyltransferase [Halomonas sp. SBBP1]|nr:class I SAM-dependent methyltransferase [Halomonas sp. SBBP1]